VKPKILPTSVGDQFGGSDFGHRRSGIRPLNDPQLRDPVARAIVKNHVPRRVEITDVSVFLFIKNLPVRSSTRRRFVSSSLTITDYLSGWRAQSRQKGQQIPKSES